MAGLTIVEAWLDRHGISGEDAPLREAQPLSDAQQMPDVAWLPSPSTLRRGAAPLVPLADR